MTSRDSPPPFIGLELHGEDDDLYFTVGRPSPTSASQFHRRRPNQNRYKPARMMVEGMIQNPLRESIHHNPTTKGSSIQPKKAARGFQRARMSMSVAPSKKSSPYKPYPPGAFQSSLEHDIGDTVTVVTPECLQQQVFAQQQQQSTTATATTKKRKPTTTTTSDTNKKGGGSLELAWEGKYAQLVQFYEKHGHANVPVTYPEDQKLSNWCRRHRDANNYPHLYPGGIRDDRRAKLNALGFDWKPPKRKKPLPG